MKLSRTVAPTVEPVTLQDCKDWLRVDSADDDPLLTALVTMARESHEDYVRRAYITQTWALTLDRFPSTIQLWRCPVLAISSVTYVDPDGATQTLAGAKYQLDNSSEPARLVPAYNETWPTTRRVPNAVTVTFTAGYGAAATDVPDIYKTAIKREVADHYEHREAIMASAVSTTPHTAHLLLLPHRLIEVA